MHEAPARMYDFLCSFADSTMMVDFLDRDFTELIPDFAVDGVLTNFLSVVGELLEMSLSGD